MSSNPIRLTLQHIVQDSIWIVLKPGNLLAQPVIRRLGLVVVLEPELEPALEDLCPLLGSHLVTVDKLLVPLEAAAQVREVIGRNDDGCFVFIDPLEPV